ncbi:MAG: Fe-Mn family superoxide dismutase [Usitatibacter sp.]
MRYHLAPIPCRPWLLNNLSGRLVESHYENNYGGALRRLNAITQKLASIDFASTPPYELAGLKRDELAALNSTLLHELYFACLGGDGRNTESMLAVLAKDFGTANRWRDEFTAMGRALGVGSGWVLLTYVPREGRLVNQFATDHGQSIAGGIPILALDMYEHAYHIDFGANATAYVDTFMRNLDWKAVESRYENARNARPLVGELVQEEFKDVPTVEPERIKAMLDAGTPVQVIDARPRHYFTKSSEIMSGAVWRDPDRIDDWVGEISQDKPVVVFCAYGFHVGCRTAQALRTRGFDATYMAGGHSAWKAIGGKVEMPT